MSNSETQIKLMEGDFVKLLKPDKKLCFGKIDSFCDGKQAFRYFVFLQPHQMKNGAETYHSRYELIKTDKIEKEFVKNIVSKVNVYSNIETWISCANGNDMPYFYRQMIRSWNKDD